jgi:hypothetical protein
MTSLDISDSSSCPSLGFGGAACLAEIDLLLAVIQQLDLLLGCEAQQLLQLCFPGLFGHSTALIDQQQQEEEVQGQHAADGLPATQAPAAATTAHQAASSTRTAAAVEAARVPVLCAMADALEAMSAAGVELLTASLKCSMHLAAGKQQQQQQQQQCGAAQHVACSHWLAQQWAAAASTGRVHQVTVGLHDGDAGSVARLPAVAKQLLLVVTACMKLMHQA